LKLNPTNEVKYRIKLAKHYLEEAREAFKRGDWRLTVSSSQLCAEDSAKAVIAFFRVPSWSHDPSPELIDTLDNIPFETRRLAEELANIVRTLAPEHGRSTYGEPARRLTPWEIYSSDEAKKFMEMAEKALENALAILKSLKVDLES